MSGHRVEAIFSPRVKKQRPMPGGKHFHPRTAWSENYCNKCHKSSRTHIPVEGGVDSLHRRQHSIFRCEICPGVCATRGSKECRTDPVTGHVAERDKQFSTGKDLPIVVIYASLIRGQVEAGDFKNFNFGCAGR